MSSANGCKQLPRGQNMNYGVTQAEAKNQCSHFCATEVLPKTTYPISARFPTFDAARCCGRQYSAHIVRVPVLHFAKGIFIKNVWQRVHSCKISQHKLARVCYVCWPARSFGTPSAPIVFSSFVSCTRPTNAKQPDAATSATLIMRAISFICAANIISLISL
jgi:hypothetical protein